jgi:ATP-dependent Lhr-like helicase
MGALRFSWLTNCRCLAQPRPLAEPLTEREEKLLAVLDSTGASFFDPLHQAVGGGYPGETIEALWSLVWRGLITNDSLHALRAYIARPESARTPRRVQTGVAFRSRRTTPPTAQGRWSLLPLRAQSPGEARWVQRRRRRVMRWRCNC